MINGALAVVMDRLKILNLIKRRWLSNATENNSNPDKTCFFWKQDLPFWGLRTLRRYHPRCAIKCNLVVDACNMPNILLANWKAQHIQQLHKVAQTVTGGLVLLQTAFHGPLDLLPAKRRSVSIALLNFYLSSWIISLVVPPSPSSTSSVCSVASSKSVFTKYIWALCSAADGERGLPDEVSRGTHTAFCPDEQMHPAPTLCLQLVLPINAIPAQ